MWEEKEKGEDGKEKGLLYKNTNGAQLGAQLASNLINKNF